MRQPKPEWLRIRVRNGGKMEEVEELLKSLSLNTVCEEANCPNRIECFSNKTATFMILGSVCTRNCTFCNVEKGIPVPVDPDEPRHVAEAIEKLRLNFAVITSVTRDDLPNGGSSQFVRVIKEIKKLTSGISVEVLIPDFQGNSESLKMVVEANPDIINHNVETVPRLYPQVRPMADYKRSLKLLKNVKLINDNMLTKSGIMVGLGEMEEEVLEVMRDLREVGCNLLTIGQYLSPSEKHHPIVEYINPEQFEKYKKSGYELGFNHVSSAPLVRSSYHAGEAFLSGRPRRFFQ